MGFHLDTTGNVWLGSGSSGTTLAQAITNGPPNFYVTSLGSIYAAAGTVGGITIDSTGISANYDAGNTGFKIFSSDGSAEFDDVTIRAEIQASSLTGGLVMGSGGEIKTSSGTSRIEIGNDNETYISFIQGSATTGRIETIAGTGGADTFRISSFLNDDLEIYAGGGQGKFNIVADEIYIPIGATLSFSGASGSPGEVLTRNNAGGANWAATSGHSHTGYSFPNSGVLLSDDTHAHGTPLTSNHENAANPHDNYLQESDHNQNNTAHSNFIENADLSSFISSSNSAWNDVVDHTDITANQGGGSAHGMSLSGVNAAVLHVNDTSVHTNHNHNYGLAEDPHGNGEHSETYITNNNANAHHGNSYAAPHNGHSHDHDGSYAAPHNHPYEGTHNHPYAGSSHNHNLGEVSGHGNHSHNHANTYAALYHNHGNTGINPFTHDDRLLNINANTVPGLNVVQKMNPVTANFSTGYLQSVQGAAHHLDSYDKLSAKTYRLTHQDVVQALTDDGIDPDDVAMVVPEVRYAKEHADELNGDEMKGLMDGEIDAILVQAIKDMSAKIDLLEDRIATLEG